VADDKGAIHGSSDGGVAGKNPDADPFEFLVGPTTSDEFNTGQLRLVPVACFRVDDVRFDFDSSFVSADPSDDTKDIRAELKLLVDLLDANPQSPLSVFGHADPVGSDDYNKQLSGRRATVIYALLISTTDPDAAVKLWQGVATTEKWGASQRTVMQTFTGLPDGTSDSDLFKAYMQKLAPPELKISKQDFLAQGADANGKGDYQGCSEFNPILIFSQTKNNDFEKAKDKTPRNDANAPNRRVLVLLFQKGSKVDPANWPCPRATEGVTGCRKRFWSDGETRRSKRLPDQDRKFEDTKDTFACRFYHRLLTNSPCEKPLSLVKIRLFDPQGRPLPFAPCLITESGKKQPQRASGAPPSPAGTTAKGTVGNPSSIAKEDAIVKLRVQSFPATVNVKWSRPKQTETAGAPLPNPDDPFDFEYEMDVTIDIPDDTSDGASKMRLKNLGYDTSPPKPVPGLGDPITAFQRDYKTQFSDIVVDGTLNQPTVKSIRTSHDAASPVLKAGGDIAMQR
jgi:hypothetical protein